MKMKPTRYIKYQTWTLILIQALPLFILPEFIFPLLGKIGALGAKDGFILSQVFPGESYWRSYGFILAWPLNFSNLYIHNVTTFWLVFSLVANFCCSFLTLFIDGAKVLIADGFVPAVHLQKLLVTNTEL